VAAVDVERCPGGQFALHQEADGAGVLAELRRQWMKGKEKEMPKDGSRGRKRRSG